MNDKDLEKKIKDEMDREVEESGFSTPLKVLVALKFLDDGKVEEWKKGNIQALERVINLGPQKVLRLLSVMSANAKKNGYKVKREEYLDKNGNALQFSRSNNDVIEGQYSALYYDKFFGMRD